MKILTMIAIIIKKKSSSSSSISPEDVIRLCSCQLEDANQLKARTAVKHLEQYSTSLSTKNILVIIDHHRQYILSLCIIASNHLVLGPHNLSKGNWKNQLFIKRQNTFKDWKTHRQPEEWQRLTGVDGWWPDTRRSLHLPDQLCAVASSNSDEGGHHFPAFVFVVDFLQALILIVVPTYIMADWFFDRVALVINIGGVSNS